MRWKNRRGSENVEDRRGMRTGPMVLSGGGGILGLVIVLVIIFMGGDPAPLLNEMQKMQPPAQQQGPMGPQQIDPVEDELAQFSSVVLADTEEVWHELFRRMGRRYQEPRLILYRDSVASACGYNSAATGPFYCPGDSQVYLDLSFFDDMSRRLGAPGDFAQAYVIAHEVGHHVQNLLGISDQVHNARARVSQEEYNRLSVRLELQADFLAGVWAHHAQRNWHILEKGDIQEALRAATAIGDDRLQKKAQGYVVPESFTHGTSEQRVRWFSAGLKTGDVTAGDTFSVDYSEL